MRVSRKEMDRSHDRILGEASRLLRRDGIENTGVKEVMAAAGMTHGGFYRHFANKEELVARALETAFDEMVALIDATAQGHPDEASFARQRDFYLSDAHVQRPETGCPAAALGSEVARAPDILKARFGAGVERMVSRLAESFSGAPAERRTRAYRELAMMAGAVMLARACEPEQAARVLGAVRAEKAGRPLRPRKAIAAAAGREA